jgi:hypothetical protein
MNKRLAMLGLVSILTATLASCGEGYNYRDGIMLYMNGTAYTTDELFKSYVAVDTATGKKVVNTAAGAKAYYTVLNNIAVEASIPKDSDMDKTVQINMDSFKKTAKDNASKNGTTEAEELEKALTTAGYDTLEELENSYYLKEKTTKAKSVFQENDSMFTDGEGTQTAFITEMINNLAPYHIRHILAKFDSGATSSLYQGTITESDAKQINNIVTRLASTETYGSVALTASDDSSSSLMGSVGIMSKKTGDVSEFKYGIYTYDALFNSVTNVHKSEIESKLFSTDATNVADYEALYNNNGAAATTDPYAYGIPYSAVKELGYYADKTTSSTGLSVTNAQEYNYPRNVLFNNYFNNHMLSFIYLDQNTAGQSAYYTDSDYNIASTSGKFLTVSGISDHLKSYTATTDGYFTATSSIAGSQKILCDEKGRPILVTRAGTGSGDSGYNGVHFIVIENDPFTEATDEANVTALKKYYRLTKPSTNSDDDVKNNGASFINYITTTNIQVYTDRAALIKKAALEAEPNIDYAQYKYYMNKATTGSNDNKVTVAVDSNITSAVNSYISAAEASTTESTDRSYNLSWDTYLKQLQTVQQFYTRIIPVESGISAFLSGDMTNFNNQRTANAK